MSRRFQQIQVISDGRAAGAFALAAGVRTRLLCGITGELTTVYESYEDFEKNPGAKIYDAMMKGPAEPQLDVQYEEDCFIHVRKGKRGILRVILWTIIRRRCAFDY